MGAQIILYDGFEVVPPPEMNDLLLFGSDQSMSNADASTVTTEEESTVFSGESSPAGVAEEEEDWPTEKPFRFYFVKQPFYKDPEIKSKIDEADHEIYLCNKRRIDISNLQKSERAEFDSLFAHMGSLVYQYEGYKVVYEEKKKEFETVQESLKKLCCSRTGQLCFTKEELDHLMNRAYYPIEEEDWVLKEVEKPEGTTQSYESLTQKEAYIQRFKSVAVELNEVKREQDALTWKINQMSEKLGKIQQSVAVFDVEMAQILDKRDKAFQRIKTLRIQRDKGNAAYYQNLAVMKKAKELAASGNARDLEEFASSEVDKFMCHWNNDKAFRDEYEKRISSSLDERQLSRDGRIRNPESEVSVKSRKEGVAAKSISSNSSQDGINVATDKQKKEVRKKSRKSSTEESDVIDLEFPVYEKPCKEEEEVDEETLKQRKREEQLEKARLAMERKKKRQEKTAAKAAIKAQKEAEKKLKECEKKAKKKAAANEASDPDRPVNAVNETSEMEKEKCLVSVKEKHQKERSLFPKQRSFRYKHRGRGTEALPKAILNRRRAHRYWIWGCSAAALAFALFLVVLLLR